ncbi:hypothetical protein EJ02DRAFT_457217, partial [Clathrospora elynae]
MAVFGIMLGLGAIDIVLRVFMKERLRKTAMFTQSANGPGSPMGQQGEENERSGLFSNAILPPNYHADPQTAARTSCLPGILALLAAIFGMFIDETIIAALCATLPVFVYSKFHWTALPAGLLFLCITIPVFGGPLAGALFDRFGACWIAVNGFTVSAPVLVFIRPIKNDTLEHEVILWVLLTLAGTTVTFFLAPLGAECSFVAEEVSESIGVIYMLVVSV